VIALARSSSNCASKSQIRLLVREGARYGKNWKCFNIISVKEKNWSRVPDGGVIPGQTGRLTIGRKITLTLKNGVFWVVSPCGSYKNHTA
jgi:hypothetical protein